MFVGHFAVGLAGKRATPRVSLGTWFLAVQFLDLLWPIFLLLDWEHVRVTPGYTRLSPLDFYDYPLSHSLLGAVFWSFLFAAVWALLRRQQNRFRTGLLLGAGVLSHWVLDFLTHRPDLPLLPKVGPYAGLGLWNHPALAIALEGGLYAFGIFLYVRSTRARDSAGRFGLWALLLLLLGLWLASAFGPPPEDEAPIAWTTLSLWVVVFPWAGWVDRHRSSVTSPEG